MTLLLHPRPVKRHSLLVRLVFLNILNGTTISFGQSSSFLQRSFSSIPQRLSCEGSASPFLLRKLENDLKDHRVDEAWKTFNIVKNLYGLPEVSVVSRLITQLSYSLEFRWLKKACNLVLLLQNGKQNLLHSDFLIKLSLSLARAQMPSHASMMLRLVLERKNMPPSDILCLIIMHMVKTETGSYLASNILVEICDTFQCLNANKFNCGSLEKPDSLIFNLVLDSCVRFESSFKGQQLIELMSRLGVSADAHSIVIISQIHAMNGQRDELKKFKIHIDRVMFPLKRHYRQFYDSLLSLHLKYEDIEVASQLVLDMYKWRYSLSHQPNWREEQKPSFVSIGSHNLKTGLKLAIMPELLRKDSVIALISKHELISYVKGKFVMSKWGLAKLIILYKNCGMLGVLSKFLTSIEKEFRSEEEEESSLCAEVFETFIHLGWLEIAHDILEDIDLAGFSMGASAHMSLFTAYNQRKMFKEAQGLSTQMRKFGLSTNDSDKRSASSEKRSELHEFLVLEMKRNEKKPNPLMVYKLNSSIYFFCKAKMIEDALKTYRRMQEMKIQPTVQTFTNMVQGYSSLEMYREITILWGDIKRNMENQTLMVNRDLFEVLLINFIRGGYFERVMEVIKYMEDEKMFTDKWLYRKEFLKLHKDLYKNLLVSEAKNEAQSMRLEFILAFKEWVGID